MRIGKCLRHAAASYLGIALALGIGLGLLPVQSFAENAEGGGNLLSQDAPSSSSDDVAAAEGAAEGEGPQSLDGAVGASAPVTLASALAGGPTSFVNAEVALGSEPVVGSFTVDGMTFAVKAGDAVELVGVAPGSQTDEDSEALAIPESVFFEGVGYDVASIGAYAFYLSGATSVVLLATVSAVDERAFRSSDVAWVEVDPANESYASFDGALYSADMTRILLVPEGRSGQIRIPSRAASLSSRAFSHCALLEGFTVDADCPAFSSGDGALYDGAGATLLRVAPGATEITLRDGCTAIAAGALEGCASLGAITAPASVASVSPYLFEQQPEIVMAPVALAAVEGDAESSPADGSESADAVPQITAMVALTSTDDGLPEVDPAAIEVRLPEGADAERWRAAGFSIGETEAAEALAPIASVESSSLYAANTYTMTLHATGGTVNGAATWQASVTVGYGNNVTRVNIAVRTGYIFQGYYTNTSGGTQIYKPDDNNTTANIVNDGTYWKNNVWVYEGNQTFYAQWQPIEYSLSLHPVGGTIVDSSAGTVDADGKWTATSVRVAYNQARWDCVSVAARPGYTFKGYYTNSSGGTQIYRPDSNGQTATMVNDGTYWKDGRWIYMGNATFYAQWTANTITLTWNSNGGSSVANTTQTYSTTAMVTLPSSPTRAGYTFKGWFTSTTSTTQVTSSTALPTSNTTYYAQWTANTITITWNSNGGSSVANTSATYSSTAKVPMPGSNPTRAGYTFKGWFTSTTSTTQVTSSTALPTSNTTYYAQWTANTITLTWNSNGGSTVANTSKTYAAGATVPMPSGSPTRAGYTFKGWFTSTTSTTQVTSSTALPTSNTTYYAQWTANTITLTWNSNGGSSVANTSATYSSTTKVPMPNSNPTRAGYTFKGWFTSTTSTTQVTSSTALPTSNTTYYAQWTANTITITWNSNGGSSVANTSATYSSTAKVPMPAANPTRAGYTFAGWWTAASGGTQVTSSTALPTANATYYAHWSLNPYAITYDLAGGSVSGNPTTYNTETTSFTLKNPTRTGYTFAGWSGTGLSGSANMTVTIATGSTGDRAYTAHWTANAYTVEYWDKADTTMFSSDSGFRYDTARALSARPDASVRTGYTSSGWATAANQSTAAYGFGSSQRNLATSGTVKLYLAERPNAYTVSFDEDGGQSGPFADIAAIYDQALELPSTLRQGYIFQGWKDAGTGALHQAGSAKNLASDDGAVVRLVAQWTPALSADVPIEVTARVDVLGLEEQEEAQGYIESRCGEPLTVADVAFEPLSGATELFGAASVANVALEVRTDATASPDARFALDASATQVPVSPGAFRMASYGTRVPISYRFAIPDELLPSLVETTKPVCAVAYTVALATP